MHSKNLNSTQLNSTGSFSSVELSTVHWTGDSCHRFSTSRQMVNTARYRFCPVINWMIHKNVVVVVVVVVEIFIHGAAKPTVTNAPQSQLMCPDCEEPVTTANFVEDHRGLKAQRENELNYTEQLSWVEFRFPLCILFFSYACHKSSGSRHKDTDQCL